MNSNERKLMACWVLTFCGKTEKPVFVSRRGNWTLGPKVLGETELRLFTSSQQPARHPHKMHSLGRGGSELLWVAASYTRLLETLKENNTKL